MDNKDGIRVLPHKRTSDKNSIAFCKKACFKEGFKYAGVEYANECFCGNKMPTTIAPKQSDCNMDCSGNKSQKCGGGNRLNLYTCTYRVSYKTGLTLFFAILSALVLMQSAEVSRNVLHDRHEIKFRYS